MDKLVWFAGMFGILMTLPQVWRIWGLRETAGVSVLSWSAYLLCAIIWTLYGIVHKEKVIIVTNTIWIFLDVFIVLGVLLY